MKDWKKYWDNVDTGLYALIKQVRKTKTEDDMNPLASSPFTIQKDTSYKLYFNKKREDN